MGEMTRSKHLAWAKARALECVERGDAAQALASMTSDLGKHPETVALAGQAQGVILSILRTPERKLAAVRQWIEGLT